MGDMGVQCLENKLFLGIFLPSTLVTQDRRESDIDLADESLAQAAIDLRGLVIEDGRSETNDCQSILHEYKAVDDGIDGFDLDLLKIVLQFVVSPMSGSSDRGTYFV